jgi:hypothetical protein
MPEKRYWFSKRKPGAGWGWQPCSRAGWIATVLFVVVDAGGVAVLLPQITDTNWWMLSAWCIGWTAAFFVFVFAKGEPLRKPANCNPSAYFASTAGRRCEFAASPILLGSAPARR